jgi:hypothetical protein
LPSASDGAGRSLAVVKWSLAFYRTAKGLAPACGFLIGCPQPVREMLLAIVVAVRDAPPPSFPPSKMWHVMHGEMKGFYEARDEHDGQLYRMFCVLDSQAPEHGLDAKALALICGAAKPVRSTSNWAGWRPTRRPVDMILHMNCPSRSWNSPTVFLTHP